MSLKSPRFLDPKSDVVFKKIFGQHPDLVKSFLNNILPLPEGHLIESVQYLTPEQTPRIPGMKNTIVDVKCTDQTGRIFIVEMQMTWSKSFMKRFLFGTSKAFVQQLDSGATYDTLCPVYGLALVNQTFEDETKDWFHHYRLTNVKDMDKALEGIELVFLELPKFNPKTFEHRKIGILWLRFLREMGTNIAEIPEEFKADADVLKAVELTEESAYTKAELEAYDYYLDALRVEKTIRIDAREEGLERGREEGRKEGRKEGREEGREEGEKLGLEKGKREAKMELARSLLAEGFLLEKVAQLTGLSVEEIRHS